MWLGINTMVEREVSSLLGATTLFFEGEWGSYIGVTDYY